MRFALLGTHPDGVDLAQALVDSGRHELLALSGELDEHRREYLHHPRRVSDPEEILADPAIQAVIVAGRPTVRAQQLRRALQSERPVLCVHPADEKPDLAYEAAMIQADTKQLLLPILPEGMHPAITRLAEFLDRQGQHSPLGSFRLLLMERYSTGEVLENLGEGGKPSLPGWDVLRRLGGELGEVSTFANAETIEEGQPVLLAGRFEQGGLFQVTLVPQQPSARWRLVLVGERGQAELLFPQGWSGPAFLNRHGHTEESWLPWDPWPRLVEMFEKAHAGEAVALSWQDEVRLLELDDAARGSVQRRRVQAMEYQEASEEVGFKGTMALAGCGLLWGVLLLLIVSRWVPWAGWLILPLLLIFMSLQALRYLIPKKTGP